MMSAKSGTAIEQEEQLTTIQCFEQMHYSQEELRCIYGFGFEQPTQLQRQVLPAMASGRDIIAQGRSGSGKTASYILGAMHAVSTDNSNLQVAILTRATFLATSIKQTFSQLAQFVDIRVKDIGGNSLKQEKMAIEEQCPQVIMATPSNLLRSLSLGFVKADYLKILVIDEADQLLCNQNYDNFLQVLHYIPEQTQMCIFSSLLPDPILKTAEKHTRNPAKIARPLKQGPPRQES